MARLYRYADSNDKSGYFIIGDNGNATFQVKPIAKRLLDRLEYHPPIKTERQGPQIPSKLHWLLFDTGWVFTGDSESGTPESHDVPDQPEAAESLTDEMVEKIRRFAEDRGGDDAQELANRLDLNITEEQERLATLAREKQSHLEAYASGYMRSCLTITDEESIDAIDVTVLDLSDNPDVGSLNFTIESSEEANFRHTITSSVKNQISVVSATDAPQTWKEQGRMNRHRGHLLALFDIISEDEKNSFNFDEKEMNGEVTYSTSFEEGIVLPDSMREV